MQTSAAFRQGNQVLYSARILRGVEASRDYSAGWGAPHSTGKVDVIDLNGNGQPDFTATENFGSGESNRVALTEPAIASPNLDRLEKFARSRGAEVLTQADLPQGVYVHEPACEGRESAVHLTSSGLRPLNALVNDLPAEFDPAARYALDFATNEFLIYRPA